MTYSFKKQEKINEYLNKYYPLSEKVLKAREFYSNRDIIVTGFSGGLGQSLGAAFNYLGLERSNIYLIGRNDNISGAWSGVKINNKVSFCDITKITDLQPAAPIIFHFAGYAQPAKFLKEDDDLVNLNTSFISKLLSLGPDKFIYSSTTEIYSGNDTQCDENTPIVLTPDHQRGIYIYSKLLGEAILFKKAADKSYCFRVALATPAWYEETDERVLANLITKAKKEKKVYLLGGHASKRSYQYGPLCALKMLLVPSNDAAAGIYNLSGGELLSLKEIAEKIARFTKANYLETDKELNLGAPSVVNIKSDKINSVLGGWSEPESFLDVLDAYLNE